MAKKKGAPAAEAAAIVEETTKSHCSSEYPPADGVLENLKELNGRLVKETMESRVHVSQLLSKIEDVSLESSVASEVERAICHVVLAESFKEVATVEKKVDASEEIERVKVELEGHIREKTETARCLDELRRDFDRLRSEKTSIEVVLGLACKERDECRKELGQFRSDAVQEIERVKVDLKGVVKEKTENARCLEELRMDFDRLRSEKVSVEKVYEVACKESDASREEFHEFQKNSWEEMRSMKADLEELFREKEGKVKCLDEVKGEFTRMMEEKESVGKKLGAALSERDASRSEFDVLNMEANSMRGRVLELEDVVAMSNAEFEEMKLVNERKIEALVIKNNLVSDEMEKETNELEKKTNAEIQRIRDELRDVIRSSEDFGRDVCEAENRFQSLIDELKAEISLLKRVESEKETEIASLDRKNAEYLKEIGILNGVIDPKMKEDTERISELSDKLQFSEESLRVVGEDKIQLMSNISKLECEIGLMKAEEKSKASIISELERNSEGFRKDISRLHEELGAKVEYRVEMERTLTSSMEEAAKELNDLRKQMDDVVGEKDEVKSEASNLRKSCNDLLKSIDEHQKKERGLEARVIVLEVSKDAVGRELEEVKSCANLLSENTLSALKQTVLLLVNSGDQETIKELPKSVELTDDSINSFLAGFVSVNKIISNKAKEMESVKQELVLLKEILADAKKRSLWGWMSSATTVIAAVAYALRSR